MDEQAKVLVQENSHNVYMLSAAMNELEAIQFAVGGLMNDVDEGISKSYHETPGMAQLFINEIEKKLRLIDIAFLHINKEIQSNVDEIEDYSKQIFDLVVKESVTNN